MTAAYTDYQSIHHKIDHQLFFTYCKENQPVFSINQAPVTYLSL